MDLRQLKCFVAVAEELHFGKAAERMGLAPPALSRQVRALEEELGASLLARTTRSVNLTRAGLLLLDEAKAILARADHAARHVREAASSTSKVLRIGAIDGASASFLPQILTEFRQRYPGSHIQFTEAMTAPQLQMLDAGKLDLCLVRPPRRQVDCAFEILRVEMPLVVMPETHPLTRGDAVTMRDLVGEPFIVPSRRVRPYAYDLVMTYFDSVGTVPNVVQEVTEKPAMFAAVAAGIGLALAPDWTAAMSWPGVTTRRLKGLLLDPPPDGALVGVAWRPHQRLAARDAFLSLLRERVSLTSDDRAITFRHLPRVRRRARRAATAG